MMSRLCFGMVRHNDTDHTSTTPLDLQSKPPEPPTLILTSPTHFKSFKNQQERELIKQVADFLSHSGFYWGPMEVDEAHTLLAKLPLGTFLIRDSMQANVFFTLSYRSSEGPTSVRVLLKNGFFNLAGSKHSFTCFFGLLGYYIASPKKSLTQPYRGDPPQTLQEVARRAVIQSFGRESIPQLPLSRKLKHFLCLYPFSI